MKLSSIIIALIIILFTGCTITQEYHFNNDFSGDYTLELEMGDLINMIKSMDTTGDMSSLDSMDQSLIELSEKYKEAGAKNINTGWKDDKNTLFLTFDFENLETLNDILNSVGEESDMFSFAGSKGTTNFSNKGSGKIIVDLPEYINDSISENEMDQMKEYLSIETIFSFDREIKKVKNENAVISEDKKSFKFEGKINDFMKEGFTLDSDVKLKRK